SNIPLVPAHRPPISTLLPYTTLFRSAPRGQSGMQPVTPHPPPHPKIPHPPSQPNRPQPGLQPNMLQSRLPHPGPVQSGGEVVCRSEEHTSELQSLRHLVCCLLLEKKK